MIVGKTLLISVEGIDGSGKSTFIKYLSENLKNGGYKVTITSEPNSYNPFWILHRALSGKQGGTRIRPFITIAARYLDQILYYSYAAKGVDFIIQDRYILSGLAYQSSIGFDPEKYLSLNKFVLKPDFIIYINVPLEVAIDRISKRDYVSAFWEREEILKKVKENYERFLDTIPYRWGSRIIIIDNGINNREFLIKKAQEVSRELQNAIKREN